MWPPATGRSSAAAPLQLGGESEIPGAIFDFKLYIGSQPALSA